MMTLLTHETYFVTVSEELWEDEWLEEHWLSPVPSLSSLVNL